MNRWSIALLTALLAAMVASPTLARPASAGGYSIQIEDEYGRTLPTYHHRGSTYVQGQYGTRYNVRISNHTGQRIEAVLTVDGRDAISGSLGDYSNQRGYVIEPYGSVVVDGFRQSLSAVAAFRFTHPSDSYSARRGSGQHNGVIGVAVFRERTYRKPIARPRPVPRADWRRGWEGDDLSGAPSAPMGGAADSLAEEAPAAKSGRAYGERARRPAPRQNLGTRYGETRHSPVVEVPFRRAQSTRPNQILAMYYDDASGLARRGIPVYSYAPPTSPSPFPRERQFAPPPPRW